MVEQPAHTSGGTQSTNVALGCFGVIGMGRATDPTLAEKTAGAPNETRAYTARTNTIGANGVVATLANGPKHRHLRTAA